MRAFDGFLRDAQRELSVHIDRGVERVAATIRKQILSGVCMLLALVFICMSVLFFLTDYIGINNSIAFLIIGGIALVAGLIIKLL